MSAALVAEAGRLINADRLAVAEYLLDSIGNPQTQGLALARARLALARGDEQAALAYAGQAAAAAPAEPMAVGLHATLLMERGQHGIAARTLNAAIDAGAADEALHVALVVALLELGERGAARIAIARGLLAVPDSPALLRLNAGAGA